MPKIHIAVDRNDGSQAVDFTFDTVVGEDVCVSVIDCFKNILPVLLGVIQAPRIGSTDETCSQVCSGLMQRLANVAESAGASGDILKMLLAFFMQILPLIVPYLTPKGKVQTT